MGKRKNLLGALSALDPERIRINGSGPSIDILAKNRAYSKDWATRRRMSGYKFTHLHPPAAAAAVYLCKQWGFESLTEATNVALLHLCVQTRKGLAKLELTV
jgi:hypothetical protein